jgi:perosamine synthetase
MTGENEMKRGMILTAGPSISEKEVDLVMEAVTQGWNSRHSEFIKNFQTAFAEYLGVKYAMCTSSCTGALHLALAGLGLKHGDEVLVPENTWVASGIAPTYVGAKPVFVDIEPDTWCMSPESLLKQITPKTKAIIPVHLYGHPCDMDEIMAIAKQHNLLVIEDAAPSVGARWKGQLTGSFGDASAFSFQGAKIMVSGEGGMFCTNDETLYKKAQYLNDYAVDTNKSFWIDEIGFKYRMSNLQAAIGLAQLLRIEELVDRKRQIFKWYEERLKDFPEFYLSAERPNARNIYWMSSIVLNEDAKIDREAFRAKLKDKMVDTRPFFHPMSSLPVFTSQEKDNPIAYSIANRGINLPSGHNLREDDIDYIADSIAHVLNRKSSMSTANRYHGPTGKFTIEKNRLPETALKLPFTTREGKQACLEAITYSTLEDNSAIALLAQWREKHAYWFPAQFKMTEEGTRNWLKGGLLDVKDRFLFWVIDSTGKRIGHVGLFRVSLDEKSCEIDNILRGEDTCDAGIIESAICAMLDWQRNELNIPYSFLREFGDNQSAINLYERLGYKEIQRIPLKRVERPEMVEWREINQEPYLEVERYFVTMRLDNKSKQLQ